MTVINLANGITFFRILCSLALLFCMPLSLPFYVLYAVAGSSDILDGRIARNTNTATKFGAKLDTLADIVFTAAVLIKLLPDPQAAPMDDRMGRCDRANKARQHRDRIRQTSHADSGSFRYQQSHRSVGVYSSLYHSNHQHTIHRRACLCCRDSCGDHGESQHSQ